MSVLKYGDTDASLFQYFLDVSYEATADDDSDYSIEEEEEEDRDEAESDEKDKFDFNDHVQGKQKLFSSKESRAILKECEVIIRSGPICKIKIARELGKSSLGKRILEKYDINQVQSRIKYERRKYRSSKSNKK